jgi:1-acyl-sn-glycerol-3-phosphate acyltransferase
MIFPEGTRNRNNADLPAKAGAVTIAAKTDIPVLPVGFQGRSSRFKRSTS